MLVLLLSLGTLCAMATRGRLRHAREVCASIPPGTSRADVESLLTSELGATVCGYAWKNTVGHANIVDFGRRGPLVSWSCEVSVDDHDAVVEVSYARWVTFDFHGSWDHGALRWIESTLP